MRLQSLWRNASFWFKKLPFLKNIHLKFGSGIGAVLLYEIAVRTGIDHLAWEIGYFISFKFQYSPRIKWMRIGDLCLLVVIIYWVLKNNGFKRWYINNIQTEILGENNPYHLRTIVMLTYLSKYMQTILLQLLYAKHKQTISLNSFKIFLSTSKFYFMLFSLFPIVHNTLCVTANKVEYI